MLRRSFRFGLIVGLLAGVVAAIAKAFQARTTTSPAVETAPPWTPLPDAQPVVVPPRPPVERPKVEISQLQESPAEAPAPKSKPKPAPKPKAAKPAPWVDPVDGECPPTHPIKAKMSSGIYHVPGGFNYERTRPDRCYRDEAAAEADGLRPSKR